MSGTRKRHADFIRSRRCPTLLFPRIAPAPHHVVQRRLVLDAVVGEREVFLEIPAGKDQVLMVRRDVKLVLVLDSAIMQDNVDMNNVKMLQQKHYLTEGT